MARMKSRVTENDRRWVGHGSASLTGSGRRGGSSSVRANFEFCILMSLASKAANGREQRAASLNRLVWRRWMPTQQARTASHLSESAEVCLNYANGCTGRGVIPHQSRFYRLLALPRVSA